MRVGVLLNPQVARWHERAIESVAALDGVRVTYAAVDDGHADESSTMKAGAEAINRDSLVSPADVRLFYDVLSEEGLKAFLYADQKLGWHVFDETERRRWLRTRPVDAVDCLTDAEIEACSPHTDGAWKRLPEDVVGTIERRCDVVLRFGFGLVEGDVLTAPEHGVLSTHGSDIREYRGMGPQLSFLNDDERVTVTLQRLTEDIDGGSIVAMSSADVPANATLDEIGGLVLRLSTEIFADGVRKLQNGGEPWVPDSLGEYYPQELQRKSPRFVGRLVAKNNYYRLRNSLPG